MGRKTIQTHHKNNETIHYTKKIIKILRRGLCADDPLATITLPQRSLSSQSLGNQKTEYITTLAHTKSGPDKQQHTKLY